MKQFISVSWGAFERADSQNPCHWDSSWVGLGWGLGICLFKSSHRWAWSTVRFLICQLWFSRIVESGHLVFSDSQWHLEDECLGKATGSALECQHEVGTWHENEDHPPTPLLGVTHHLHSWLPAHTPSTGGENQRNRGSFPIIPGP